MKSLFDTICAPITGPGVAPVALVRVSGAEAWSIASLVFSPWPTDPRHLQGVYGRLSTGDDGIAVPFETGRSYTGEESVELSLHGSPASVGLLMEQLLEAGARMAEPGEFTYRAFMNGRIDLTQAESVRDTVEARTRSQLRAANLHREGILSEKVRHVVDPLRALLAAVEASVDFSEEIGDLDRTWAGAVVQSALRAARDLLGTERAGRLVRAGVRVAIVGRPNAGKSSLLNAVLRSDRAIVSPTPGTTRDYIEEAVEVDGLAVVLYDTAGLRDTSDEIEGQGVERTRRLAAEADLVWHVYDLEQGWSAEDADLLGVCDVPVLMIANKVDLVGSCETSGHIPVSALTGEGLAALLSTLRPLGAEIDWDAPLVTERHARSLRRVEEALETCRSTLANNLPDDLLSVGLSEAISAFGEITGDTASEQALEEIFRNFCIGK